MRAYDVILKKRQGEALSTEEIAWFIDGFVKGDIPDYQVAAWLMAVYFRGMDARETADLTRAMMMSGDTVDLSGIRGIKVDKHSTGGVGDTTTLVLAPLVAACGAPVAKMSGRGLGHTGGTLDKLESIPGFNVALSVREFVDAVNRVGVAVVGQTGNLVPADKLLYALRDVTATVDSIPLIASSIMSKKLAAGADAIVLDVKTGTGAFMKSLEDSKALAQAMVDIGNSMGKKTVAAITDMNQPLGLKVGNSLEVEDAIETLRGDGSPRLRELCIVLGGHMLKLAGLASTAVAGSEMIEDALVSGRGLEKFAEMIRSQGGDPEVVSDPSRLPRARHIVEVKAKSSGYVASIDAEGIGVAAMVLGAGRTRKDDSIDLAVGLVMEVNIGDKVERGDVIARVYANDEARVPDAVRRIREAIRYSDEEVTPPPLVYDIIE